MTSGAKNVKFRFVSGGLEGVVEADDVTAGEIVVLRHRHEEGRQSLWYRRHGCDRGTVNRSRVVGARIGLYGRKCSDHPASRESGEDDSIRRDAPFGGVRAHDFDGLDAVRKAVLTVLVDRSEVAKLSPEARAGGLAYLRGVLAFELNRSVLQNDCDEATGHEPFRDIVTFRVNGQRYEAAAGGDNDSGACRGRRGRKVDG